MFLISSWVPFCSFSQHTGSGPGCPGPHTAECPLSKQSRGQINLSFKQSTGGVRTASGKSQKHEASLLRSSTLLPPALFFWRICWAAHEKRSMKILEDLDPPSSTQTQTHTYCGVWHGWDGEDYPWSVQLHNPSRCSVPPHWFLHHTEKDHKRSSLLFQDGGATDPQLHSQYSRNSSTLKFT